ncbi:MAG: lectin like domain-containing protein [Oscillospiraceae bacterium]
MNRRLARATGIFTAAAVAASLAPAAFAAYEVPDISVGMPTSFDLRDYGMTSPVADLSSGSTASAAFGSLFETQFADQFPGTVFDYDQITNAAVVDVSGFSSRLDDTLGTLAAWRAPVLASDKSAGFHLQTAALLRSNTDDSELDVELLKLAIVCGCPVVTEAADDAALVSPVTGALFTPEKQENTRFATIAGWDDNYPRENFLPGKQPQNNGAWLVKYNDGVDLGDTGYVWVSYEDKTLSPSYIADVEPADNYASIYQYDTVGFTGLQMTEANADGSGYMANIFTAEDSEQLEAVSFYTTGYTMFEISVYTGVQDGDPDSGTLALTQTDFCIIPGYYTISLDKAVALQPGEDFSVVVEFITPDSAPAFPVELVENADKGSVTTGRSYVSSDGAEWKYVPGTGSDGYYVSSVCLKAFTNPLPESGEAVSNVRFSLMEGEIASGSRLELYGEEEIWYSIDGGAAKQYTAPITLKKSCTVSAWSVSGGNNGNTVTRSYTTGAQKLSELLVLADGEYSYVTFGEDNTATVNVENDVTSVRLRPRSGGKVVVNGIEVASDALSQEIPLLEGENVITVCSTGIGKVLTSYTVKVFRSPLRYNSDGTVSYNTNRYTAFTPGGEPFRSGDRVTGYIGDELTMVDRLWVREDKVLVTAQR